MWRRRTKRRSPWTWKQDLIDQADRQARARRAADAAHTSTIRALVFARDRSTCRAWLDGHRFAWCTVTATDMHEGKTRGAGGDVSTRNSLALCHACHMKRHGIGAWLRIRVTDADRADGVVFVARVPFTGLRNPRDPRNLGGTTEGPLPCALSPTAKPLTGITSPHGSKSCPRVSG